MFVTALDPENAGSAEVLSGYLQQLPNSSSLLELNLHIACYSFNKTLKVKLVLEFQKVIAAHSKTLRPNKNIGLNDCTVLSV